MRAKITDFIEKVVPILNQEYKNDDAKLLLRHLAKLHEESGELSHEVLGFIGNQRKRDRRDDKYDKEGMAKECVDVILSTLVLAKSAGLDMKGAFDQKMEKIAGRLGFELDGK